MTVHLSTNVRSNFSHWEMMNSDIWDFLVFFFFSLFLCGEDSTESTQKKDDFKHRKLFFLLFFIFSVCVDVCIKGLILLEYSKLKTNKINLKNTNFNCRQDFCRLKQL